MLPNKLRLRFLRNNRCRRKGRFHRRAKGNRNIAARRSPSPHWL